MYAFQSFSWLAHYGKTKLTGAEKYGSPPLNGTLLHW